MVSNGGMRKLWLAAGLVVWAGCAGAPIKKSDLPALAAADAQVLQGCYDCLQEARATYARIGVGKARPLVVARLFETDVLIGLRERELALDATAAFDEARSLARELPLAFDGARIVAMADAVPGDDLGWTHREVNAFRRAHVAFVPKINDELAWLATTPLTPAVRTYVQLSVDCAYPTRLRAGRQARFDRPAVPPEASPLVAYRIGICMQVSSPILEKVRKDEPRFVEIGFFLTRPALAIAQQTGGGHAREWLDEAYKRFPASPAVTYLDGNFNQIIGDCRTALKFYDETIALRSEHELALLGRVICLTYVKRSDEAIAEATHMIDLKLDNIDQAYYWRSWNHFSRQELDVARADIEDAKKIRTSNEILTLAGMIEHDQNDLDPAERDLHGALDLSSRNCTAMWYLGSVAIKREQWLDSGRYFESSMHCYGDVVKEDEDGLAGMQGRTDLDPEFRARQIAGFEAALKEDRAHQYAAAFNAANQYAHGGNVPKARPLLEFAAQDPSLATQVAQLRKIIGGG